MRQAAITQTSSIGIAYDLTSSLFSSSLMPLDFPPLGAQLPLDPYVLLLCMSSPNYV